MSGDLRRPALRGRSNTTTGATPFHAEAVRSAAFDARYFEDTERVDKSDEFAGPRAAVIGLEVQVAAGNAGDGILHRAHQFLVDIGHQVAKGIDGNHHAAHRTGVLLGLADPARRPFARALGNVGHLQPACRQLGGQWRKNIPSLEHRARVIDPDTGKGEQFAGDRQPGTQHALSGGPEGRCPER